MSINQTASTFTCFKPMFINIEVKGPFDERDPLIQLGAWCSAEFEKRHEEKFPLDMPVVAISVVQDTWDLYIVYATPLAKGKLVQNRNYIVNFLGPTRIGDTISLEGIFRLLHVLVILTQWGLNVYKPWFEKHILRKRK